MSKVLLILVSILNAARNSISFFLLLIVCLGYGVVRSNLGRRMLWARILAATHFIFGVIYAVASLTIAPENVGPLILLVVLPLAGSLTAFYIWTLNALAWTLKDLQERKQRVKAQMYRKLWYCIIATIVVIFAFFFLNSFTFAGANNPNYTPSHWQTRWFVLDGWLNLVYLADVAFIAYLWRPTANNRRFAMSEEVNYVTSIAACTSYLTPDRSPKTTKVSKCPTDGTRSTSMLLRITTTKKRLAESFQHTTRPSVIASLMGTMATLVPQRT